MEIIATILLLTFIVYSDCLMCFKCNTYGDIFYIKDWGECSNLVPCRHKCQSVLIIGKKMKLNLNLPIEYNEYNEILGHDLTWPFTMYDDYFIEQSCIEESLIPQARSGFMDCNTTTAESTWKHLFPRATDRSVACATCTGDECNELHSALWITNSALQHRAWRLDLTTVVTLVSLGALY